MVQSNVFNYYLSHEIDLPVSLRLGRLKGCLPQFKQAPPDDEDPVDVDVFVEAEMAVDGHPVGSKLHSPLASATRQGAAWDSADPKNHLSFVVKYKHLLAATVLGVTVWAQSETEERRLIGSAVIPLFSRKGRLKAGLQSLTVVPDTHPDLRWPSATPGKGAPVGGAEGEELRRLELAVKQYQRGEMVKVPWLDVKTMRTIRESELRVETSKEEDAQPLQMLLELPTFSMPVLYSHPQMHKPLAEVANRDGGERATGRREAFLTGFVNVHDPEVTRGADSNPCEYKALKLGRALGKLEVDQDAKPNKDELKVINEVLALSPSRHLSIPQRTVLWKFRLYLTNQPRALVRFLKSVDWADAQEAHIAIDNMRQWQGLDVEQALQMLTADFEHVEVRSFAVEVLRTTANDAKLLELMIQLVQCVRYDPKVSEGPSPVADFLVERCHMNSKLAVALHWSLIVDCEDPNLKDRISGMMEKLYSLLRDKNPDGYTVVHDQIRLKAQLKHFSDVMRRQTGSYAAREEFMRAQLTESGCFAELLNIRVSLPEDPSIYLVAAIPESCKIFKSARAPVKIAFLTEAKADVEARQRVVKELQNTAGGSAHPATRSQPPPTLTSKPGKVEILYKDGDDLRQDQFICQLIKIMDQLLKRENLDLRLTPYWVLPTSPSSGILEFVPSTTLQEATSKGGGEGIVKFLASHRSGHGGATTAVPPEAMENFVRSTAGYAIISYLLDLGDRHLENLLLTNSGKLFHIDFGYVFGMRDPKPWAKVPLSIKPQIVAAMGGVNSEHYRQFRQLACEAYCILRKHASFFLTLLKCMAGSAIDCFAASSNSVSLDFAMSQLEERLTMDMTDDDARDHIFALLDQSVNHIMARIGDDAHRIASQLR